MISEEEKLKFQNYFKNIGMAMNNPNGFGPIMNKNLPMHIIGGCSNWYSIYNIKKQNQNQYQINSTKKLNAQFITTTGLNINIYIDTNKKVTELIEIYFKRVERPDLFKKTKEICFIYNATKIDINEQKIVKEYFIFMEVRITVHDIHRLIGAL